MGLGSVCDGWDGPTPAEPAQSHCSKATTSRVSHQERTKKTTPLASTCREAKYYAGRPRSHEDVDVMGCTDNIDVPSLLLASRVALLWVSQQATAYKLPLAVSLYTKYQVSDSLNAGLIHTCSSVRSERDQTHHCATLTTYIGAAGLQGIPRHPGGLLPPISPPQALLHHTVPNNPGAVPRQNHIGWLSGAHCHCHPHSRHRILHILMHLLLLLLAQHLLQGILSTITADLPHQGKDLCMRAVRILTLLQSRRLTRCTSMMRSSTCITSMLLTVPCAPVRLSMHGMPHTWWLLTSFRKPSRLSMHSVLHIWWLLITFSKPSRLSMQSLLLTSRQGTGCTWALLQLLSRVIQVQLFFVSNTASISQVLPDFSVGMLAKSEPHYTHIATQGCM